MIRLVVYNSVATMLFLISLLFMRPILSVLSDYFLEYWCFFYGLLFLYYFAASFLSLRRRYYSGSELLYKSAVSSVIGIFLFTLTYLAANRLHLISVTLS